MGIFSKKESKLETTISNIWGHISAAEKNSEQAKEIWNGRNSNAELLKNAVDNVQTLMEMNTYNLVIRDKIIEKKEEYQLVKLVAHISAAEGTRKSLINAANCYANSIEAQLKDRGLSKDTVQKMIEARIGHFEKEKEMLIGVKGLIEAGIFQDPNSPIRYKSTEYRWSEKNKSVVGDYYWVRGFIASDLSKNKRDATEIENDIRAATDLKIRLPHMTDLQMLSMLEDDFGININGAKQKSIVVTNEIVWKKPISH